MPSVWEVRCVREIPYRFGNKKLRSICVQFLGSIQPLGKTLGTSLSPSVCKKNKRRK
jgi:hypothetical protein